MHEHLTNEALRKKYPNVFQLALLAIHNAQEAIQSGKEVSPTKILNDIKKGDDV